MAAQPGAFIVIEGADGSGKSTQFELLSKALIDAGYDVATVKFPRYSEQSSYFVREYLSGAYGSANDVGPYTASLFYALDRYAGAAAIREALAQGKVVLADRYVGANMAHQGTKFENAEERRGYFIWLDNLEFEMLRVPRPDATLVLRVPTEISQQLLTKTGKQRDIHEADPDHLKRTLEVYDDLTQLFPKDFMRLDCTRDGELLSIDTIHQLIWQKVLPLLPPMPDTTEVSAAAVAGTASIIEPISLFDEAHKTAGEENIQPAVAVTAEPAPTEALVQKRANGSFAITDAGRAFLHEAVSDTEGDVYAFTSKLSPITIAAAMARLSRRGDDMRVTILDEFAGAADKDKKLLQRVITAFGDDSVQQLTGIHFVVENASNLLTKKLEWGRLAAYLEQSTRYIYFDQKDANGRYRYYTPGYFADELRAQYETHMDQMFDLYAEVVHKLTTYIGEHSSVPEAERDGAWRSAVKAQACDAARPLLPVATTATVGIFASGQALENLIMHLQSDELPEARKVGDDLLREARKVVPTFLERADKPDRGGAIIAYRANTHKAVQDLAMSYLPAELGAQPLKPVQLTDIWPRNELDLVPDMLYEHSTQSLEELRSIVTTWPYQQKMSVFEAYMGERLNRRHRPGRALEKAHYSWDLICDYGIFRDLQRHRMVDDLEWQQLTPRYGYEVPELVEESGLTELFEASFDKSLELYSLLQSYGYTLEAQYATLLGHRMRWKVTYNAREAFHLHELRTTPQGHPGYRKLVLEMHEHLAEKHPLLAEAMRFVNTGEDPELSRLAAERYTQFKLEQLDD